MAILPTDSALAEPLLRGLPELGLDPEPGRIAAFLAYLRLLAKWNQAYNLTSIREPAQMAVLHILDSLTVRPFLAGGRILDVGSGAGLPGIPLALTEPARHFTLVDSTRKKVRFMRQAIAELGIGNAVAEHARIQALDVPPFDTIVSRAFASLSDFHRSSAHLLAPGGQLVAMKGRLPADERDELLASVPAGTLTAEIFLVRVPGLDAERHVVVVRESGSAAPGGPASGDGR